MDVRKTTAALAAGVAFAIGIAGPAWAGPAQAPHDTPAAATAALPDGWDLRKTPSGFDLTWQATARVPAADARVEFYAGDRLLGRPWAGKDQRTFRLALTGVAAKDLTDLQVRAGGRRLDAGAPPAVAPRTAQSAAALAQLPPNPVDPGVAGPYTTISGEYTLPDVSLPGLPVPVEMTGYVVAPQGTTGQRPVVLLLHGRHDTCYQGTQGLLLAWPCPAGWSSLPSYRGFQRQQQLLASQGYVTVSISANGINAQDNGGDGWALPPEDGGAQARSSLVRLHLGKWADWAGSGRPTAPAIVQSAPVPDMTRVLLMGHSRGGEGVNRAAIDSLRRPPTGDGYTGTVRWTIRGLALIGPTTFMHNPVPDVPTMTILPSCDGDVSDLEGQMYIDATRGVSRGFALHSAVFALYANHNYFNTEWTPGLSVAKSFDDYPSPYDPVCRTISPNRLTPDQQQNVGATYVATAAALFVAGNDQVRPLIDGSGFRAPSADPASVLSHAVGGNRSRLVVPDASTVVTGTGGRLCEQVPATIPAGCESESPHFATFDPIRPEAGRHAVLVNWTAPGTPVTIRPAAPVSISGAQQVALRVAIGSSNGVSFDVAITDTAGRRAVLGTPTGDQLPWPSQTRSAEWGQEFRVPLTNATNAGLNLSQIASLEITPRTGDTWTRIWLIDAWGWRPGTPAPQTVALPRVDIGERTVLEGNSGTTTYLVPATVTGSGAGQVRVFVVDPVTGAATATLVSIPSGSTTISIPVAVTGNTQAGDGRSYIVGVKAVQGVFVGDSYGQLTVQDDD
jgi:hypothetical protein